MVARFEGAAAWSAKAAAWSANTPAPAGQANTLAAVVEKARGEVALEAVEAAVRVTLRGPCAACCEMAFLGSEFVL